MSWRVYAHGEDGPRSLMAETFDFEEKNEFPVSISICAKAGFAVTAQHEFSKRIPANPTQAGASNAYNIYGHLRAAQWRQAAAAAKAAQQQRELSIPAG